MKYKVGTKVRVVNPYSGSEFEDGDIVTIIGIGFEDDPDCYEAILSEGDFSWYLREDEVAPLTNGDKIRGMDDRELGIFLCASILKTHGNCEDCKGYSTCNFHNNGLIDWLKQPIEENE